mmetsp:Transcript_56125/g.111537  ORF Transcript_56125/g.111537 Transcript_56125/m.111537 type:complete len:220 (-) Transcript_56125:630-1289(-)
MLTFSSGALGGCLLPGSCLGSSALVSNFLPCSYLCCRCGRQTLTQSLKVGNETLHLCQFCLRFFQGSCELRSPRFQLILFVCCIIGQRVCFQELVVCGNVLVLSIILMLLGLHCSLLGCRHCSSSSLSRRFKTFNLLIEAGQVLGDQLFSILNGHRSKTLVFFWPPPEGDLQGILKRILNANRRNRGKCVCNLLSGLGTQTPLIARKREFFQRHELRHH